MKTTQRGLVPPRPLEMRTCKCGCGNEYQPYRRDQVYLNRQHGNLGYNHFDRKTKDPKKIEQVKVLAHHDRIHEKTFNATHQKENTSIDYFYILMSHGYLAPGPFLLPPVGGVLVFPSCYALFLHELNR